MPGPLRPDIDLQKLADNLAAHVACAAPADFRSLLDM